MFLALVVFLAWGSPRADAQANDASPIQSISLRDMSRNAAYIFAGKVMAVEREFAIQPAAAPIVRITFQVEHAIRGVSRGQILTIHEWAGRWEAGESFHPRESILVFLYPPSKLGLTSVVGGSSGRFAIDSSAQIIVAPDRIAALALDPARQAAWQQKGRVSSREFADAIRHSK
jgi:hypothetical protein